MFLTGIFTFALFKDSKSWVQTNPENKQERKNPNKKHNFPNDNTKHSYMNLVIFSFIKMWDFFIKIREIKRETCFAAV